MTPVTRRTGSRVLTSSIAALLVLGATQLPAQTFTWNVPGAGGSWLTDTNWTPTVPGDYPKDAGDIANLTANLTANAPITLDGAITLGGLTIGDSTTASNAYTISDGTGGSLTFDNLGSTATLTENASNFSDTIAATIKTVGNLNITDLNATAARTFTLSGSITSSAASGTQLLTFSQASTNAAVVVSGSVGDGGTGGKIAITKTGSGTLSLRNTIGTTANAFSGDLTITAGQVRGEVTGTVTGTGVAVGSNPFGTAKIILNGGSLGVYNNGDGAATVQTIIYGNNVDLNANGSVDVFHNGTAAATNKTFQFGTLTVNGNFAYSQNGSNTDGIRFEGGLALKGNATIQGTSAKTTFLTINGITEDATPRSLTFNLVGTAHTTTLVGIGVYSGGTIINGGTVNANATGALGTGVITLNGGTLNVNASSVLGAGAFTVVGGTLSGAASGALNTPAGITTSVGSILLRNYAVATSSDVATTQTFNLSGGTFGLRSNAITGNIVTFPAAAVNITGGTVAVTADNNGTALAAATVFQLGAPLTISGSPTITSASGTNASVTVMGTTTLNSPLTVSNTTTFRLSSIAEDATPRKITKIGSALLNLTGGTVTWTGGIDLNAGSVQVSAAGGAGTGVINVGDTTGTLGATLFAGAGATVANDIVVRSGSTGVMVLGRDTSTTAGTGTFSGLITLNRDTTIKNDSASTTAGNALLDVTGKITGANVKLTTSARVGATNQFVRFLNAANDFGFAAPTPDAITVGPGVSLFSSDGALGAAGNGITLSSATSVFRLDGTFSTSRTITFNTAGAQMDVTAGNEVTLPVAGQIQGTVAFAKGNTGILTITGDNSARTLGTNIVAGSLRIATSDKIGLASPVGLAGGTLDLRNDVGTTYSNLITVTASSTINSDQAVGGTGTAQTHTVPAITSGAVTLTTTAGNNYSLLTGAVTETAGGTITNNIGGTGTLTLPSVSYNAATAGTVTLRGTGTTILSTGFSTLGAGAMAFTKSDAGTVFIQGTSSYTGLNTFTNGIVRIIDPAALGSGGAITLGGGTIAYNNEASTTYAHNFTVTASSGINVDRTPTGSASGNTHTVGTITSGAFTLTTTAGNNYSLLTGAVTETAGGTITNNIGGTGTLTIPSLTYNSATAGTVTLRGTGVTVVSTGLTTAGAGVAALTKTDAGIVTLIGPSSYTGLTTVSGGILRAPAINSIGTGGVSLGAGTLALLNDASTNYGYNITASGTGFLNADRAIGGSGTANKHTVGTVTLTTQTLTFTNGNDYSIDTGAVTDTDSGTLTNNLSGLGLLTIPSIALNNAAAKTLTLRGAGTTVVSGAITQTGAGVYALTKLDAGTLNLNGATTITGNVAVGNTTTTGGLLKVGAAGALPNSVISVLSGTLDLNGFALTPTSGTNALILGGGPTATSANLITNGAAFTLGGNVAYNTTGGFLGATITGDVGLGGATRTFTVADTTGLEPDLKIDGSITDATGGIIKLGAGSLLLAGSNANTWAGTTTLNQGNLLLGKPAGINAIPGDLAASSTVATSNSLIKNLASQQIPDTAAISLTGISGNGGANWDLGGFDETIASLTFNNNQGTGSEIVFSNGGTLRVNGPITVGGTSGASVVSAIIPGFTGNVIAGKLDLGGAVETITVTATGNATVPAIISNGGILKAGATILILSGANTYAGGTEVQAGTLDLRNVAALGAGNVLLSGGNLTLRNDGDGTTTPETINFSGGITATANATILADRLSGTPTTKTLTIPSLTVGANTLTFTTNNSYQIAVLGTTTLTGSATFTGTGVVQLNGGLTDGGGGFGLTKLSTGTLSVNNPASLTTLTVTGGTVNLNAATSLTSLTLNGGSLGGTATVTLSDSVAPLTIRNNTVANSFTFTGTGGGITFDSVSNGTGTLSGALNLGAVSRPVTVNNGTSGNDLVLSGVIAGTAGWTKEGAGLLLLSGAAANTNSGPVTVNAGVLNLSKTAGLDAVVGDLTLNAGTINYLADNQLPDTSHVTVNGGTLNFMNGGTSAFNETIASLNVTGGAVRTVSGTIPTPTTINILGTLSATGGDIAVNSGSVVSANKVTLANVIDVHVIGGSSTLVMSALIVGPGGLEFTGSNLRMNTSTTTGALGSRVVLGGDVTSFASAAESGFYNASGTGAFGTREIAIGSGPRTFTVEDGLAFNDLRADFALTGTGSLVKAGDGRFQLLAANTYSGNTDINAGTLVLGSTATLASPVIHVAAGATFDVNLQGLGYSIPSGQSLKADGTVSGSLSVTGSLSGTGLVTGNITVLGGGVLAPGASPGVLTLNGTLSFNDSSAFTVELGGNTPGTGAGHYDQLNAGFSVFLGNSVALNLSLSGGYQPTGSDVFYILTRADLFDFSPSAFFNADEGATVDLGNGYTGTITYAADWLGTQVDSTLTGGNDVAIYNVVPEPATATFLLAGLALLAKRPRRRQA